MKEFLEIFLKEFEEFKESGFWALEKKEPKSQRLLKASPDFTFVYYYDGKDGNIIEDTETLLKVFRDLISLMYYFPENYKKFQRRFKRALRFSLPYVIVLW